MNALRASSQTSTKRKRCAGDGAGLEGCPRISSPLTFGRLHLVPALGAFLDANPKVRLELVMDDRIVDLVAENIDAALRLGVLMDSALKARRLAQTDRVVVASPAYLTRKGVLLTPADLLEHHGIVYGQNSGGQEWVFRRGSSETSMRIQTRLILSAAEGVREAVLAGEGFAISSRWMFAPELANGEVVSKKPSDGGTHWSVRNLAAAMGVSKSSVQRILSQARLQPHRLERYMTSNDAEFESKAADIIGLFRPYSQNQC